MAVVSLALFKKHVRADDFADDDVYLEHLLEAAEVSVISATNRNIDELTDNGVEFPASLKHAIMMLAAHWYNQRESVSSVQMHEVPDSLQALVKPYRKLV
jgi:DNA packaging protein, QLRG family